MLFFFYFTGNYSRRVRKLTDEKNSGLTTQLLCVVGIDFYSILNQHYCPILTILVCLFIGDDTLKLWDLRNFKKPLKEKSDLLNFFPV